MSLANNQQSLAREIAAQEAAQYRSEAGERLKYSVDYAQSGLKALFLVNGGSVIGLLTFLGNSKSDADVRGMFWAFSWFLLGLTATLAVYLASYFSQNHLMNFAHNLSLERRSEAVGKQEKFDWAPWEKTGNRAVLMGVSLAVVALGMFVAGAIVALVAIT